MSPAAKRTMEDAMVWIFRASTALGAFFLFQTYNEIKELHKDVESIVTSNAVNNVRIEAHSASLVDLARKVEQIQTKVQTNDL